MENKKFNLFAAIMIVVMAIFTIYTTVIKDSARDGRDGLSAYELAQKYGDKSESEFEWVQSLYGKDGSNVTLQDVYEAYLKASGKSKDSYTFTDFILDYYPDKILDADETATAVQSATQSALRSTVDICYSFCLDKPILYVAEGSLSNGTEVYQIITTIESILTQLRHILRKIKRFIVRKSKSIRLNFTKSRRKDQFFSIRIHQSS